MLLTWPVYVLVALGVTGFLLNQRAYQLAPLASSLPALNIVNRLVAALFGALGFNERPSGAPAVVLAELVGLAGVSFLAACRSESPG